MKKITKTFLTAFAAVSMLSSCSKEEFAPSMFPTDIEAVDKSSTTAPFDQWLYETFVLPYNTTIDYKLNLLSDLNYQLAPAEYKKSQMLAHFIKYLFYDVYDKYGVKNTDGTPMFMKEYAPRLFHFIGSKEYSPSTGTETLGYASGGVKITLINVNGMNEVVPGMQFTPKDIETLNKDQFHTMHHEFSHILHQRKQYPVDFGQVTPGVYDAMTWQDNDSTKAHGLGFVTHYCMSANTEDFVEVLSCTITDTDHRWMTRIIDACLNGGVKQGDKEKVYTLLDSLGIKDDVIDCPTAIWNNIKILEETIIDETGKESKRFVLDDRECDREHNRIVDASSMWGKNDIVPTYTVSVSGLKFRDFLDTWVEIDTEGTVKGMNAILTKMEKATRWYTENFGLHLFAMREEVRQRQNKLNDFIKTVEIYDYK